MNPLVSIIIPTFNREELIGDTLDSVLNQTYENWECIVVDDGSNDNTQILIKKYAVKDKRIIFLTRNVEPKGASSCRNIGLNEAKGEYIVFLDSDDYLATNCLFDRVLNIKKNPDFDFWIYPSFDFFKQPGDTDTFWNIPKNESDLQRFLKMDVPWSITGPIWNKQALKVLGGFNTEAKAWQDWELSIRAILADYKYKKYNAVDHYIRTSGHHTISTDVGNNKFTQNLIQLVSSLYANNPYLTAYKIELKRLLFYLLLIYRESLSLKDLADIYNKGIYNKVEFIYIAGYFNKPFKRGNGFLIRKIFKLFDVKTYSELIDQTTFRCVSHKEYQVKLVSV